jgi:cell division protein FtsQ
VNTGKTIRKIVFIGMWLVIGGGMVVLLAAAVRKQKNDRCRDYSITVKGQPGNLFVDGKEVEKLMMAATTGKIKGQPISTIHLRQLEQLLEDNTWINDAQLYFDNRDVLHITVTEREPIARIFNTAGKSYYIDSSLSRMPLSDKVSARVPVFTDFPEKNILTSKDSLLLKDVRTIATFIIHDDFWMSQVAQIAITPEREFEMIPVVGVHTVELGDGTGIAAKFHRLFVFYDKVLSKTGFDKYKTIDVQYEGQVVGSKSPAGMNKIDSVQLRRNVEKLLKQANDAETDTIPAITQVNENSVLNMDNAAAEMKPVITPVVVPVKPATNSVVTPMKPAIRSTPVKHDPNPVKTNSVSRPKAVMPKH